MDRVRGIHGGIGPLYLEAAAPPWPRDTTAVEEPLRPVVEASLERWQMNDGRRKSTDGSGSGVGRWLDRRWWLVPNLAKMGLAQRALPTRWRTRKEKRLGWSGTIWI
ncbi:hypothetical protein ACJRO7_031567 [Eucalyptus globulus]|uniref:Uncharacterized protein n=1 Tax=Eucalyptus globulus TaxID=34317 RepID=A0ABD3JGT0_EUCGL